MLTEKMLKKGESQKERVRKKAIIEKKMRNEEDKKTTLKSFSVSTWAFVPNGFTGNSD